VIDKEWTKRGRVKRIKAAYSFVLYLHTVKKHYALISPLSLNGGNGEKNTLNCPYYSDTVKTKKRRNMPALYNDNVKLPTSAHYVESE